MLRYFLIKLKILFSPKTRDNFALQKYTKQLIIETNLSTVLHIKL